jgi:hypothetical protein
LVPCLPHVQNIVLLNLPDDDLSFFTRIVRVTPNLHRLSVYLDDLLTILSPVHDELGERLQQHLEQLEIRLDDSWLSASIHRDIPKILETFSNLRTFTVILHAVQKHPALTVKELLLSLLTCPSQLLCIYIQSQSSIYFDKMRRQDGIAMIRSWLASSGHHRLKYKHYLLNSLHIEMNASSIAIWM